VFANREHAEMTTNELKLAKAFRDAGLEQDKAETIAQTIFDAIRDNVATKTDLAATEQALKNDVELVRRDLTIVEQRLRGEIQSLKIWGGGTAVAAVLATVTLLHYWPPHS
jgi:ATP/maltotriose-dependent transcriptional regulator MalT